MNDNLEQAYQEGIIVIEDDDRDYISSELLEEIENAEQD